MNFAWKFMLPMALIAIVAAAVWFYTMRMPIWARWLAAAPIIVVPYLWLGNALFQKRNLGARTYRFAE
jgi:NADH-quinone oxidoreductase subunit H